MDDPLSNYMKSIPKGTKSISMSSCPGGTLIRYFYQGTLIEKVIPTKRSKKK